MDIAAAIVALLAAAAPIGFVAAFAVHRGIDLMGAGFVPFRTSGWPRGVQNDDPPVGRDWQVPGSTEADPTGGAARDADPAAPDPAAEIVDLYAGRLRSPGAGG